MRGLPPKNLQLPSPADLLQQSPLASGLGPASPPWTHPSSPPRKGKGRPPARAPSLFRRFLFLFSAVSGIRFLRPSSSTPTSSNPNRISSIPHPHTASS